MNISFWEKDTFLSDRDYVIIGSGIVGLTTALTLRKFRTDASIAVFERGFLPTGASTKNAGFACFGSLSEILKHEKSEGTDSMLKLVKFRFEGLNLLRKWVPDTEMDYEHNGGYEIFIDGENESYDESISEMDRINRLLEKELGIRNVYQPKDEKISQFGLQSVNHLIFNSGEGQLHSGKMIRSLMNSAAKQNIQLLGGMDVSHIGSGSGKVLITLSNGIEVNAGKVILTTNAFSKKLLPELDVIPGRGQVLVTKPIPGLMINGCFHYEQGYYYFRNIGERILLGGGRNIDFKAEETTEFGFTEVVQQKLNELLGRVILPDTRYEIDLKWSGIMCFGSEIEPIIKEVKPNIFTAVRMSGMGVAIGSKVAETVTELVLSKE